jgi:hypothetical protein
MFGCQNFCGSGPFARAKFRGGTIAAQHHDADGPALKSHKQNWLVVTRDFSAMLLGLISTADAYRAYHCGSLGVH